MLTLNGESVFLDKNLTDSRKEIEDLKKEIKEMEEEIEDAGFEKI